MTRPNFLQVSDAAGELAHHSPSNQHRDDITIASHMKVDQKSSIWFPFFLSCRAVAPLPGRR